MRTREREDSGFNPFGGKNPPLRSEIEIITSRGKGNNPIIIGARVGAEIISCVFENGLDPEELKELQDIIGEKMQREKPQKNVKPWQNIKPREDVKPQRKTEEVSEISLDEDNTVVYLGEELGGKTLRMTEDFDTDSPVLRGVKSIGVTTGDTLIINAKG